MKERDNFLDVNKMLFKMNKYIIRERSRIHNIRSIIQKDKFTAAVKYKVGSQELNWGTPLSDNLG